MKSNDTVNVLFQEVYHYLLMINPKKIMPVEAREVLYNLVFRSLHNLSDYLELDDD